MLPTKLQVGHELYNHDLFSPVEDLSNLSENGFTTLAHPAFPRYNVRMKKTSFCDETVKYASSFAQLGSNNRHSYISVHIQVTLILKLVICSSISLRAGTTPTRTT